MKHVHSLPENMYLNQALAFQNCQRNFNFFGRTHPFLPEKLNAHIFLHLKDTLVATFSEKGAPTSETM